MRLPWVFLCAIIPLTGLPSVAWAQDNAPAPVRQALPSGLRVVVLPNRNSQSVVLELRVRSGSADSPPGLAHFLEHSLFHGGRDRTHGEIDRLMETIGGEIDARTYRDSVRFRVEIPVDRWRDALAVLAELTLTATVPDERIAQEQRIVAEERRFAETDPVRVGTQRLFRAWFPSDPYGTDPLGNPDDTALATGDTLRQLHRTAYRPERMSLVVGGSVDPAEVIRVADALFVGENTPAKFRPSPTAPVRPGGATTEPAVDVIENARLTWIHLGFRVDDASAAGVARAEALAHWLSNPDAGLWSAIPETNQPYLVQSEVFPLRRSVLGIVRCATEPKKTETTLAALDARIRAWASEPDPTFETKWKSIQAGLLSRWDQVGATVAGAVARAAQHEGRDAAGDDDRVRAAIVNLTFRDFREALVALAQPGGLRLVRSGAPAPGGIAPPGEAQP